ncbi:geranylgeranyl pyrophosphate synthase [[Candida] jaroonii]|uniref:Geranylgeranyl pyrophosphate synthase n=1 Tax=[Candida] jaroonii TaxID=467808 RepID=A0ACA9YB38_9ASCO|nr:geranylgeranyl pyrophosphate synthase [[Candida] jaroonii]
MDQLIKRNDTPLDREDPMTEKIIEPLKYLQNLPGNNRKIRMIFIKAFNELYFHIENEELIQEMNEIVDMLHDCSLLIDDIEDSSEYRRGSPTAHIKFGQPITINCSNLNYFIAINKANNLSRLYTNDRAKQDEISLKVNRVIVDEMLNLHHGQGIEIYWRDNKKTVPIPTELQYLEMAMDKTGGLLRIIVKLLECFVPSESSKHIELSNLIGIIYQLRDDYFNLVSDQYSHMKGVVGEDLIEGKFSFPILHSLNHSTTSPVYDLLYNYSVEQRKAPENQPLILAAITFMKEQSKSLDYTNDLLKAKLKQAEALVEGKGEFIKHIFNQLNDT